MVEQLKQGLELARAFGLGQVIIVALLVMAFIERKAIIAGLAKGLEKFMPALAENRRQKKEKEHHREIEAQMIAMAAQDEADDLRRQMYEDVCARLEAAEKVLEVERARNVNLLETLASERGTWAERMQRALRHSDADKNQQIKIMQLVNETLMALTDRIDRLIKTSEHKEK